MEDYTMGIKKGKTCKGPILRRSTFDKSRDNMGGGVKKISGRKWRGSTEIV